MSALQSAAYLEIRADLPLDEKIRTALGAAQLFEQYIMGMTNGIPLSEDG